MPQVVFGCSDVATFYYVWMTLWLGYMMFNVASCMKIFVDSGRQFDQNAGQASHWQKRTFTIQNQWAERDKTRQGLKKCQDWENLKN